MARRSYLDPLQRDQVLAARAAGTPINDGSGCIVCHGTRGSAI